MRATTDRDGVRRPRFSKKNLILAALVFFGALAYLHFSGRKFAWWKQAAFAGEVVAREARTRAADAVAAEAAALADPAKHRFLLQIRDDRGAMAAREVIASVYRRARVGDRIVKAGGTYEVRLAPAAPAAPAEP